MILIFGREDDLSTTHICEWLYYYGSPCLVLNTDEDHNKIRIIEYSPNENKFVIEKNQNIYNLYDIKAVWNRRHGLNAVNFTNSYVSKDTEFFHDKSDKSHYTHTINETKTLFEFIHHFVEDRAILKIGSYFFNDVNKLTVLYEAKKIGLNIPETIITSKKTILNNFINCLDIKKVITKPLTQGVYNPSVLGEYQYYNYVNSLNNNFLDKLTESFYPSLFQKQVQKEYELRIFFLIDTFYSLAIFSQENKSAIEDFRENEYWVEPLKNIPYQLPIEIEFKLLKLMEKLNLNTGSIDMIVTPNQEYVFLEVNPCGQFNMTSMPCNYNLENKIALKLIEYGK